MRQVDEDGEEGEEGEEGMVAKICKHSFVCKSVMLPQMPLLCSYVPSLELN